jgi:glycosyltransferase involved in cell wall biosynthesis
MLASLRSDTEKRSISKGVIFQALASGWSAEAQEARAVSVGLAQRGLPIRLALSVPLDTTDPNLRVDTRDDLESLTHRKVNVAKSVLYYGSSPDTWSLNYYGTSRVGRASFWTDRIPSAWVEMCNTVDEVWVPNGFNRESFAASGVDQEKLRIVPTGIDANLFRPGLVPLKICERRKFNFLSVTSSEDRKGLEILLTAYLREFHVDDDVSLTVKISSSAANPVHVMSELTFFIEKSLQIPLEKAASVILLEEALPASEMPSLYNAGDAFVLPSRGESHGLSLLEAIACEVPVIATRWGAPLEFLNDENSYLIESEGLAAIPLGESFLPGHSWANPSVDHLRQLMRHVVSTGQEVRSRAHRGRKEVVDRHDWSAILPRWEQHFLHLLS